MGAWDPRLGCRGMDSLLPNYNLYVVVNTSLISQPSLVDNRNGTDQITVYSTFRGAAHWVFILLA